MTESRINLRIDSKTKQEAEKVLNKVGLSMTSAVTLFLRRCINAKGIPFDVTYEPNEETVKTIKSAMKDKDMFGSFNSIEECMKALRG